MTTQVKPGTRCECTALHGPHYRERNINGPPLKACPNDATVTMAVYFIDLHLCATCAAYHEARQKESA